MVRGSEVTPEKYISCENEYYRLSLNRGNCVTSSCYHCERLMSTSEVTVLTPEQPSQPIPSSKSPRKKQKSRKSKWEVARKKIRERMNLHSAELSRRLAINRRKILKEHEGMFHDLGFEASRHLSDEQEEVLRRENDMLAKRVGTILGLEKGVHDLAARLLIQHDISIDDALTVARVQVRRDFSLMTDIENHCEIETNFNRTRTDSELSLPITLEEEIKQYARNLEVTELMDSENAIIVARREVPLAREKRFRKDSKTHSTDKLFETIFRDERYKEGTENRLSNPDEFNESLFYDKSEKNEEGITVTETDENSSSHPKMHDSPVNATGPAGSLSVNTREGSSTEQRREEIATIENKLTQDDQLPGERNRLFSLAAKKVIEQNKANRDAFKSLGVAAAMSKTVPASFPEVDMGEDETEEGKDEVTTLKQQAQASKGRNRLFSLAAKKVIEQNKANRDAFKSLGVAAAMSKTVPTSLPQVDVGEEETEEDKGEKNTLKQQAQASAGRNRLFSLAAKKVIEQNKANRDAFKSLGVAAAMSKTVPASFPNVDVGEYETEEEKVEVTTLKQQAQASAGRNSLFSQAAKKVIQQNKANRDAFKSLGVAAAMSKTVPTNFPKVDVGDDGSETKERNRLFSLAAKKVIQQNKAKRHAFKSLGATGATSKKSEIILSGEGENNRMPSGAYRRELVKSLKSIQKDSDRRTEKAKKREERESKKLAEYSQVFRVTSTVCHVAPCLYVWLFL